MQIYYNFIPVQPNIFIGQNDTLQQFHLGINIHNVISVTGLPGVGKSSLTKAFTKQLSNKYNILWVDINSNDDILDIIKALRNKLNTLFNEALSDTSSDDFFLEGLQILEKNNVILVLDNLQGQNDDLLNRFLVLSTNLLSKAKIITTSVFQLRLPAIHLTDVYEVQPKSLSNQSSIQLISQLVRMHSLINIPDSDYEMISQACYGNPLIIKTFISYFNKRLYSIEELCDRNSDFFKEIENIIDDKVLKNLSEKEIELFTLFQLYSRPMTPQLINSSIGSEYQPEVQKLLANFILQANEDGFIIIAPVIQKYANLKSDNDVKSNCHKSISKLLNDKSLPLETLIYACQHAALSDNHSLLGRAIDYISHNLYSMGPELGSYQALLIETLNHNYFQKDLILSYIIDSYLYTGNRPKCQQYYMQLEDPTLKEYYRFRDLHFDETTPQIIEAYESLPLNNLPVRCQIEATFLISKYYCSIADTESAETSFQAGLVLCDSNEEVFLINASLHKALHFFNSRQFSKSNEALDATFQLLKNFPESKTYISCLLLQSNLYMREESYLQAETILQELVKSNSCVVFTELSIRAHLLLASLYGVQNNFEKALSIYVLALNLAQSQQFEGLEVQILGHLSIAYSRVNRFQMALDAIEQAIQLACHDKKTKLLWLMNLQNIGLLILLNEVENALDKLRKNQDLLLFSNESSKTYLYFYYAKAYQMKKDQKQYQFYFQKYLTQFNSLNSEDQKSNKDATNWFESKVLEISKFLIVNQSHQKPYSVNMIDLQAVCSDKHNFQVYFCSESQEFFINEKPVDIFSKRILLPLLLLFLQSPTATFSSEEIINTVWDEPVSQKTKDKLRVTMLRLSKMINNYGLEVLLNSKKNQFNFNSNLNYCLIFDGK